MKNYFNDGRDWFFEKRFGIFIHWGLYAIPAWHEQVLYRKRMSRKNYVKLMEEFNPETFNPDQWLDLAEENGMKYLCFTTKHVDGFCMWDTKQTSFNIMNTPYGKDTLKMLAEACQKRNFPLCLYYSLADMNHPNYPNQGRPYELLEPAPEDEPDLDKYLKFVKEQIKELCTGYGKIHGIWWDANQIEYQGKELNDLIRSLQPDAVINSRGGDEGDFDLAERDWNKSVTELKSFTRPLEGCQALGRESWGNKTDEDYFSNRYILKCIDQVMAKGGNYLINVGPDDQGGIPEPQQSILRNIGKWFNTVKEAILNAEPASDLVDNTDILVTRKDNTLYVHLFEFPESCRVLMKPVNKLPDKATLLNDGRELEARVDLLPTQCPEGKEYLRIRNLPVNEFSGTIMVIKLEFSNGF